MNLLPYIYAVINFVNSFPDDNQVFDLLCPAPQYTTTADGVQHKLNRGYCQSLEEVMIVEGESSLWKMRCIGLGYDGIVRRWNREEDVDRMKGFPLFCKDAVVSKNTAVSLRELAAHGIEDDCDWTAEVSNCVMVEVMGKPAPFLFSFRDEEARNSFVNYLCESCVCDKQSSLQSSQRAQSRFRHSLLR